MPIYEFECRKCEHTFEELMSRSELDSVRCPSCKGRRVRRLVSSFVAKSSGGNGSGRTLGGDACGTCTASSCAGCKA
ncbi:MAG: zinc ribbon domain-containing protein [Armatimonadota bacterium]